MSKRKADMSSKEPSSKLQKVEEDSRLVFRSSPVSLRKMAASRVAISLWYHQNVRNLTKNNGYDCASIVLENSESEREDEYDSDGSRYSDDSVNADGNFSFYSLMDKVANSLRSLVLPSSVTEMIEKRIRPIGQRIDTWVNFIRSTIFFELPNNVVYRYVDEIIFQPNGLVDYFSTAKGMLSSPRISETEKYRIICVFCMEDEIKSVSPMLLSNRYFERVLLRDHPLIYYFNCRVKGTVDTMFEGNSSVAKFMLTLDKVNYKRAILYFFNLLQDEEKVDVAKLLIRRYHGEYQTEILNRLNEIQQNYVFMDIGGDIVVNFVRSSFTSRHALKTWLHIRNLITESQFVQMVGKLQVFAINKFYPINNSKVRLIPLFANIWKNSPDHFKRYALKYENCKIIKKFLERNACSFFYSEESVEFLMEILRDADDDTKMQTIQSDLGRKFCEYLVEYSHLSLVDRFIKLCLPEVKDIFEFKGQLLKTSKAEARCLDFCVQGKISELNKFVSFYLQDSSAASNYLTHLLISENGIRTYINNIYRIDITFLRTTITQIIPDGNDVLPRFLRTMALSQPLALEFSAWIQSGEFNKTKDCISQLFLDAEDVQAVKNALLGVYQGEKISELFAVPQTNYHKNFLLWCCSDDEQNVAQFKSSLPLQSIFIKMLKYSVFSSYDALSTRYSRVKNDCNFAALDRFLLWYFVTFEKVKKFKLDQVFQFCNIELMDVLKRKTNKYGLRMVMKWFFDDDVHQIRRFRSTFPNSVVGRVLSAK